MELIIDTINLNEIKEALEYLPIDGVTCNPSIVKKTAPNCFFDHMHSIKEMLNEYQSLHVQVTTNTASEMVKEAQRIAKELGEDTYIKVPVNYEGLKAIKQMKEEGYNLTATCVYNLSQAYLAYKAGVAYIAVYVNRIEKLGEDPYYLISQLAKQIVKDQSSCKILAASLKNTKQIEKVFEAGAHAITIPFNLYKEMINNEQVDKAVKDFENDWYDAYHHSIDNL